MRAIKEARKLIEKNPDSEAARILSRLVLALKSESPFGISEIYQLDYDHFKLALEILQDWRIDRHYAKKLKLVDASMQATGQAPVALVKAKPAVKGKAVVKPEAKKSVAKKTADKKPAKALPAKADAKKPVVAKAAPAKAAVKKA